MSKRYINLNEFCERYALSKSQGYSKGRKLCVWFDGKPLKPMRFDVELTDLAFSTPLFCISSTTSFVGIAEEPTRTFESDIEFEKRPRPPKEKVCL
jgi:hypothetical protein